MTPADVPSRMPQVSTVFEVQRRLEADVQDTLRRTSDPGEAAIALLRILQASLDLEAVALRLAAEDDFTYAAHLGFPQAFIEAENCLRAHSQGGEPLFDADGTPLFECVCGRVLTGKTDAAHPLFTSGGSAWTNDARPVVEMRTGEIPQVLARNRCLESGYRSVAIIPIRLEGAVIGALQLNDRRPGRFNPELIDWLEGLCAAMAPTLARRASS